jgi:trehalose 6-phosphate phosphatase
MMCTSFLDASWSPVLQQIAGARSIVVFLDFDGTLVALRQFPDEVQLEPAVRATLESLASRGDIMMAIVSGREMWDLRRRVGIPGIVYAGEHGMEIRGRGLQFIEPGALARRGVIKLISRELTDSFRELPGVFVEEKHLTLAVHYRLARRDDTAEIRDRVRAVVDMAGAQAELRPGKMVWEILPRTGWRKGAAADWIYKSLQPGDGLPLYAGDDAADEDAFRHLNGWITIHVGCDDSTAARYTLAGPDEVHRFLAWLDRNRKRR